MGIGMVAGGLGWWHGDRDGDTGLVARGRGPGWCRPGSAPLSPRSYYGLTVWFPDMIKHLQNIEYASRTKLFTREKVRHFTFNFTLENQIHQGGEYFNDKCVAAGDGDARVGGSADGSEPFFTPFFFFLPPPRFIGLKMKSVTFEDSLFEECYFEDITSSNTFFKNCTFISTVFYNTGRSGDGAAQPPPPPPPPRSPQPPRSFYNPFGVSPSQISSSTSSSTAGC